MNAAQRAVVDAFFPPDQAEATRRLAENASSLPYPVVETFTHEGHVVEVCERPRASFARFSAFITPPGGERYKADVNWHTQEHCAEDARAEIDRRLGEGATVVADEEADAARAEGRRF